MKNIFLSRPNGLTPEYSKGLDNFTEFITSIDLRARTVGQSDQPNLSPLDGVIQVLGLCEGAIILGYPQIEIEKCIVKGVANSAPITLGTEWNHIEASLAYALRIPILVIHDISVSRGIFDRGTSNTFLYAVDLKDPSWFFSKQINMAIQNWKSLLKSPEIQIRYATYGLPGKLYDVTPRISELASRSASEGDIFPGFLGVEDPAVGHTKTLKICYRAFGKEIERSFMDGEHFKIEG